jgi:hypothetical protein
MRVATSRWRDPDFIVVFMFGAAFIAIVALITGGSETYLYITAQADPVSRFGTCRAVTSEFCVITTQVEVVGSSGDQVTLRPVDGSANITVTRVGGAEPSAFPHKDKVWLEFYQGDNIALSDRDTGALMKLVNYPEPPLRFWVPELTVGLTCLAIWSGLFLWRRHLFASMVRT